ncbi:MAG TPA: hypothetical protein VD913_03465 [bacterium]|nr:hypothetical protein [bacterium]
MASIFLFHFHPQWLEKIKVEVEAHRLKAVAVIGASAILGGTFGTIIILAALQNGDMRTLVMVLPHALVSALVYTLFLAGIFSLTHYDP